MCCSPESKFQHFFWIQTKNQDFILTNNLSNPTKQVLTMPQSSNNSNAPTSKTLQAMQQNLTTTNLFSFKKKIGERTTRPTVKKIKLGEAKKGLDTVYYFHEIEGNKYPELLVLLWLLLKADNITKSWLPPPQLVRGEANPRLPEASKVSNIRTLLTAPEQTPTRIIDNCFTNITIFAKWWRTRHLKSKK